MQQTSHDEKLIKFKKGAWELVKTNVEARHRLLKMTFWDENARERLDYKINDNERQTFFVYGLSAGAN